MVPYKSCTAEAKVHNSNRNKVFIR
uniref:Uncharacterized protein n=1 Tax=Arundo donax TaxID=35708 RepID=A0A0A9FJT5_ARUDO